MARPWTAAARTFPCLWTSCDHPPFPVGSLAYEHMTRCPHRPQESR